jgi:ABC-2 type transport system permease protein
VGSIFAVVKKDLKGYFDQPTGYILLVIFAALLAGLGFRQLFIAPEASMRAIISLWLPMLLTLFVPAATMRLVSEEQRDGTLETLRREGYM